MLTFDATEQINEVSRTTTQVITRYFGRWPHTTTRTTTQVINSSHMWTEPKRQINQFDHSRLFSKVHKLFTL